MAPSTADVVFAVLLGIPILSYIITTYRKSSKPSSKPSSSTTDEKPAEESEKQEDDKPIMQPEQPDLAPPKNDPFTLEQLKEYDGSDESKPIYVSIKGTSRHAWLSTVRPIFFALSL